LEVDLVGNRDAKNTVVRYGYRDKLLGLFYTLLENVAPVMAQKLHSVGYRDICGRYYKYYTYAFTPKEPAYTPDGLVSLNNIWSYKFGSADRKLLSLLETAFSAVGSVVIGGEKFQVHDIKRIPLKNHGGVFYCLSPLTVKNGERYLTPENPEFNDAVVKALLNRYESWTGKKGIASFRFLKPRRRLEFFNEGRILGFSGKLELYGPPEIVKFAQAVGLGQKNSIGLGMIA